MLPRDAAHADDVIRQELIAQILEIQMDDKSLIGVADVVAAPTVETATSEFTVLIAETERQLPQQCNRQTPSNPLP